MCAHTPTLWGMSQEDRARERGWETAAPRRTVKDFEGPECPAQGVGLWWPEGRGTDVAGVPVSPERKGRGAHPGTSRWLPLHCGVGMLGSPGSHCLFRSVVQPPVCLAHRPIRKGPVCCSAHLASLWRAGGGAGPAVPLWKVPGAGRLEYRSKTPPPDRTRRCLTTSVLALERKVVPDSFLHVFLHVSLPQSSSISPRRRQCCEGPGSPTWAAARWPWGRLSSVLTLPRTGRETLSDREHD